jgi:hypothetical protein
MGGADAVAYKDSCADFVAVVDHRAGPVRDDPAGGVEIEAEVPLMSSHHCPKSVSMMTRGVE